MTSVIFVGPTLAPKEVGALGEFQCLPPVSQGDVYRAARKRPRAIGIVDGYFSGAPSVWHKEILWAISEGVPVFGSASMGALRAAELHSFGMRGVGRIFEAFRDGTLEDDDEVAVLHGPAEIGHLPASEAMVNIRATLAFAETNGVLGERSRCALENCAKSLFFGDRNWSLLLDMAGSRGVPETEVRALREWLPAGRVDQKRADALSMLHAMKETPAHDEPAPPSFHFEWTYLWDVFVARAEEQAEATTGPAKLILDELRMEGPEAYGRVEARALLRRIAAEGAPRIPELEREQTRAALSNIRVRLGLYTRTDLDRWMSAQDLDPLSMERLVESEARLEILRQRFSASIEAALLDELRMTGAYSRLAERAARKDVIVTKQQSGAALTPLMSTTLRLWYFEKRLRLPMPDDIAGFISRIGFENISSFDNALYREWLYLSNCTNSP